MEDPVISVKPLADWRGLPLLALALPALFEATVDDPGLPYVVTLRLAYDGDQVACESATCSRRPGGPPVTSEGRTSIRVADLVYRAAREAVREPATLLVGKGGGKRLVVVTTEADPPPAPAGRAGPGREHLRYVGRVYAIAYACRGNPRREVMNELGLSRTTANRWITAAREGGYLPPRPEGEET